MLTAWGAIGVITGLLLGLTGAGGAIVAVPLFVHLLGVSVHDATGLSLIAVMAGAALNWTLQRRNTDLRIAFLLFAFSTLGSLALLPIKAQASDQVITALFSLVALLSLAAIWTKRESPKAEASAIPPAVAHQNLQTGVGGLLLGGLITMTGLGGGVIIMPFLKGALGLSLARATATSLLTVLLSSLFAFAIQGRALASRLDPAGVIGLIVGSVIAALTTRALLRGMEPRRLDRLRQALITVILLLSAGSLLGIGT